MRCRAAVLVVAALGLAVTGCGSRADSGTTTIKVVYEQYGAGNQLGNQFKKVQAAFEQGHPNIKVQLVPVVAPEGEYYAKIQLMLRSPSTAPDVLFEDSFYVNSDVAAGYLAPLDDRLKGWKDWADQFSGTTKKQGMADDGKIYGVPMGTDTRGLWFNKQVLAQAGLPADWKPKNWDEILNAARAIKQKVPGVIPLNLPAGKATGEGGSMQTLEMLLYGTETKDLYDDGQKKWVAPSKGMTDSLGFVSTVFKEGLGPTPAQVEDPQFANSQLGELITQNKVGILLDGNWWQGDWLTTGPHPWPAWSETMSAAPMPTQHGQGAGKVSLSGGWTLAIGAKSKGQDAAFEFITFALNKANAQELDLSSSWLPVRKDVAADPAMSAGNPTMPLWIGLVDVTRYRPTLVEYPKVSQNMQDALDQVVNGADAGQAANSWGDAVKTTVGADKTRTG